MEDKWQAAVKHNVWCVFFFLKEKRLTVTRQVLNTGPPTGEDAPAQNWTDWLDLVIWER